MTDFATVLSSALHEEAKEIAMSADMQQAEQQLQESIRSADRRRRVWVAVGAAAAVLVVAAGLAFALNRPTAQPAQPTHTQSPHPKVPYPANASQLTPPLTAQLPNWVSLAQDTSADAGAYSYNQESCLPCETGRDRKIQMYSVRYMYPLDASTITQPTYVGYVNDWEAVEPLGYGTVSDVKTTTVGGKPATTMRVAVTKPFAGLAHCTGPTASRDDTNNCWTTATGRTLRVAIVDQGKGQPPTLLYESSNTDNPDSQAIDAEFATWLATVQFP